MVLVLMGVSGCGKSTVGKMLADRLNWRFVDADDHHPQANIDKMTQGVALSDQDRQPWLETLGAILRLARQNGTPTILACSALKQSYRNQLGIDQQRICSVFLEGDMQLIKGRLASRRHAFMNDGLLLSQFETLEVPADGFRISVSRSPGEICSQLIADLSLERPA